MKKLIIIGYAVLMTSVYGALISPSLKGSVGDCSEVLCSGPSSDDLSFCKTIVNHGGCCKYQECTSRNWKFYPYVAWKYIYKSAPIIFLLWFILLLFYAHRRLKITIQERNLQNK